MILFQGFFFVGSSLLVLDYAKGFGGKYGVEKERVDKAALGYDYKGETEKHQSQKGEFYVRPVSSSAAMI